MGDDHDEPARDLPWWKNPRLVGLPRNWSPVIFWAMVLSGGGYLIVGGWFAWWLVHLVDGPPIAPSPGQPGQIIEGTIGVLIGFAGAVACPWMAVHYRRSRRKVTTPVQTR